jgi:hypothetical protein
MIRQDPFVEIEGIVAAQLPQTLEVFSKIIKNFDLIIEIGANRGGFSLWLYNNKKNECEFLTYEISPSWIQIPKDHKIHKNIRYQNCFSTECINYIKLLINSKGKTLFLCDGGNKIQEFNIYSEFLKSGDVIMLHDYADSPNESENWEKLKVKYNIIGGFNTHESSLTPITESIKRNNLQKFMYDEFLNVLWGSFIKT